MAKRDKNVYVVLNRPGGIGFADGVMFKSGVNKIPEKTWNQVKDHFVIKHYSRELTPSGVPVLQRILPSPEQRARWEGDESKEVLKASPSVPKIEKGPVAAAVRRVRECVREGVLSAWALADKRRTVQKAIEQRLKTLAREAQA